MKKNQLITFFVPISRYSDSVSLGWDPGVSMYHKWAQVILMQRVHGLHLRNPVLYVLRFIQWALLIKDLVSSFFLNFLEHILFPFSLFLKNVTHFWAKSMPCCEKEKYALCETLSKCSKLVVFQGGVCSPRVVQGHPLENFYFYLLSSKKKNETLLISMNRGNSVSALFLSK